MRDLVLKGFELILTTKSFRYQKSAWGLIGPLGRKCSVLIIIFKAYE